MILVTQGHERGVGLEVFIKALSLSPASWTSRCQLLVEKKTLRQHLKLMNIEHELGAEDVTFSWGRLSCEWVKNGKLPLSSQAMICALEKLADAPHTLFTLPTTKEDLVHPTKPRKKYLGHTEFLRFHHQAPELGMFFSSPELSVLLLSDHLPLKDVPLSLTAKNIKVKLTSSLGALRKLEPTLKRALVAGINPHGGEKGLLGLEEKRLSSTLAGIKVPGIKLVGFFPGDTLFHERKGPEDLLVYTFHDQGLAPFKALMGTLGANITLGLPYVRLSVDHGTAFALYGKNSADPRGAQFCLRKALSYEERFVGKNSHYQGPRS